MGRRVLLENVSDNSRSIKAIMKRFNRFATKGPINENDKTPGNKDIAEAKDNIPDLVVYGDGDLWHLLCKASSDVEGWMKSTKVMEITFDHDLPECRTIVGCLVQVTTQQGDHVAEALTYIPNVMLSLDGKRLIAG